jgi:MerR family transcriptional regulator, copper efflux regulator
LDRLAFIARAKQLGCSLDEVADLLAVWDCERCGPVQVRFHELVTDKIRATQTQIAELLAFSAQLQAAAGRLAAPPVDEPCGEGCACLAPSDPDDTVLVELGRTTLGDVPIACSLEPGLMADRIADWQHLLHSASARSRTADDRLRIEFGPAIDVVELVCLVEAEQRCCAFFAFVVTIDERGLGLEVDAPVEARDIVDTVFGVVS